VTKKISYKSAGVDIENADSAKQSMAKTLATNNPLVLNKVGAFASLVDGKFEGYEHPVLVCKTEEPGSKQLIAFEHGRIKSICEDLINHLINDVIVMGAVPMFVQDLIVCGKIEKDTVSTLVKHMAEACAAQGAVITGGETSEQPGVLKPGTYVLGASCIGVVEKKKIIDGSAIKAGDTVLALASSGVHTNGYSLIRALIANDPSILKADVEGQTFLDAILTPHRCYFSVLKEFFGNVGLHGMAHITGGGIPGNLNRILPKNMNAMIDLNAIQILPVFGFIKEKSGNDDADMIKTYNLGVGMTIVVDPKSADSFMRDIKKNGVECYPIGSIQSEGSGTVEMKGEIQW
jgi:phosphoribosylformylglycinamidine cyclo-ligase